MGMRKIDSVYLRGTVGEVGFHLEIPPGAMARAAGMLDLRMERQEDETRSPLEQRLLDVLSGEALRLAVEASRFEVRHEWRLRNFRWDRQEKLWRLSYPWSELEQLLDPSGAGERHAKLMAIARELAARPDKVVV